MSNDNKTSAWMLHLLLFIEIIIKLIINDVNSILKQKLKTAHPKSYFNIKITFRKKKKRPGQKSHILPMNMGVFCLLFSTNRVN